MDCLPVDHPLDGIQAKLYRAGEHLERIGAEGNAFLEGQPYSTRVQFEPELHAWVSRFQVREDPPLRLGVLVGDYVHNLRSALDHLVYALTELDGGTPDRWTQFPITKSANDFNSVVQRQIPGLSAKHRTGIEMAQPYNGRNGPDVHPLYCINELAIADKHHVVQPTYAHLSTRGIKPLRRLDDEPGPSPVVRIDIAPDGTRVVDGTALLVAHAAPDADPATKVDVDGNLTIDIAFGERAISWESLPAMTEAVKTVVSVFIPDFPDWSE
jgi:hypothetical protein